MNQPVRIGLTGAGMVSHHHLVAWTSISDQACHRLSGREALR
jgi:hypothetical protein